MAVSLESEPHLSFTCFGAVLGALLTLAACSSGQSDREAQPVGTDNGPSTGTPTDPGPGSSQSSIEPQTSGSSSTTDTSSVIPTQTASVSAPDMPGTGPGPGVSSPNAGGATPNPITPGPGGVGGQSNAGGAAPTSHGGAGGDTGGPGGFVPMGKYCTYPSNVDLNDLQAAYDDWKETVVTSEGAGGFLRIRKPDSGSVIDSTVSEGMGYGMLLTVYMDDQEIFDNLWKYTKQYLNENGLMHWEIDPNGSVIGQGAASDGDEDMAWALIMADTKWGGQGSLDKPYIEIARDLINAMWDHEVDHSRADMLKAGDQWGDRDVTNPSYFAPAYYRLFGKVTGKEEEWNRVIATSYDVIERSLNAQNGNQDNGLVPAWCDSNGTPVEAYGGAPLHFQQDSTRTPFRVGQDYCYYGEPRAKAYMEKISSFYTNIGVANISDGYELDGTPRPERGQDGQQAASFVGPAGVGAMFTADNQAFIDEAYAAVATLELSAGTIYYQKSWTALSLLMFSGKFVDLTEQ